MIYTSYFAKLKIGRTNPNWLNPNDIDLWLEELAPPKKIVNEYKYNGGDWGKFVYDYLEYLKDHTDDIERLYKYAKNKDVTLYCYERSTDNCHRHILADVLEKCYDIDVVELQ